MWGMSCFVVNGLLMSKLDLLRFPKFPIIGSIMTTLFFFLEVGIVSSYSIFVGAVLRRNYSFSTFAMVSRPTSVIRELSDFPVLVEMAELLELTEEIEELRSTTLPYKFVLFLKSWAKFILKIESVGRVGLDN